MYKRQALPSASCSVTPPADTSVVAGSPSSVAAWAMNGAARMSVPVATIPTAPARVFLSEKSGYFTWRHYKGLLSHSQWASICTASEIARMSAEEHEPSGAGLLDLPIR